MYMVQIVDDGDEGTSLKTVIQKLSRSVALGTFMNFFVVSEVRLENGYEI